MTILDRFEVTVLVDGRRANEYDYNHDDEAEGANTDTHNPAHGHPNAVTKYVEAVSGAFFEFEVRVDRAYSPGREDSITAYVYVDGRYATGWVVPVKEYDVHGYPYELDAPRTEKRSKIKGIISTMPQSPTETVLQKFQFADLETRDTEKGDDVSTFKEQYGDLGTFRVELYRETRLGTRDFHTVAAPNLDAVPEKALKGKPLDVATRYVAVPNQRYSSTIETQAIDEVPIAVFNFKYRTRRALQSLFVIERSASPGPLEERPIETLTRAEMAELLHRRRPRDQRPVKAEDKSGSDRAVKRERPTAGETENTPPKFVKGPNGEKVYIVDSDTEVEDDNDDDDADDSDDEIEVISEVKKKDWTRRVPKGEIIEL